MSQSSKAFISFYGMIILLYALNIGGNAIWTTHEAYYAEAVREMLETGTWPEFSFNYEPRFQKPPLTYWLMASSASILGVTELGLRLPIIICSLLTVLLVYLLGKLLYGEKVGLISMLIFSTGLQFVWFKGYASPEIPLTLFFTAAVFFYSKALKTQSHLLFIFSWIALGLSALTKGFPYIILFFTITILHKLVASKTDETYDVKIGKLASGLLISSTIGLTWPFYMLFIHGDTFLQAFLFETLGRVTDHPVKVSFFDGILFYPQTILWSLFPFSLIFYYSLIKSLNIGELRKALALPIIWFSIFLIVFTFSSGKLPSYILQAHPAMSLIAGYVIINYDVREKFERLVWKICLWSPGIIMLAASYLIITEIELILLVLDSNYSLYVPRDLLENGLLAINKGNNSTMVPYHLACPSSSSWDFCRGLSNSDHTEHFNPLLKRQYKKRIFRSISKEGFWITCLSMLVAKSMGDQNGIWTGLKVLKDQG